MTLNEHQWRLTLRETSVFEWRPLTFEHRRALNEHSELRQKLLSFVQGLPVQNTQVILCNARHELRERLSRWLLLARDRLDDDVLSVTHDLLSMMLGVRKPGVTSSLAEFELAGAIRDTAVPCKSSIEPSSSERATVTR
jgi:CRP-like cAMP-binding protein